MKQIEPEALYEILNADRLRYCCVLWELRQGNNEAFSNDDGTGFALVHRYPAWHFASFTGYDPVFLKEVLRRYRKLNVSIEQPEGRVLCVEAVRGLTPDPKPYECFAYTDEVPAGPFHPNIRPLAKEEYGLVRPIAEHPNHIDYAEGLFAWFDGERPLGYLSCGPEVDDIWDVHRIYTLPDYRNKGIATALAYAYLKTMREQGLVPYYSGVTNPASAAAARKAGFAQCSTRYAFKYERPIFRL
ncbi:MAG: GNAT family N-acetyltransferase [Firmicutes bacterium]|nr:GNAT family N-acetyltransferase [Bacillota bacterium]